jgi:rhodanese-related sulfurtransferase
MLKSLTALVLLSCAAMLGSGEPWAAGLTMAQVERMLGQPGVFIYDVNPPEIWQQNHLPGAVLIDRPDLKHFLPRDRNATLIFYCANRLCLASSAAAAQASRRGYKKVFVMPEGIFGWVRSGRPVESSAKP